jgi:hypothetical protein
MQAASLGIAAPQVTVDVRRVSQCFTRIAARKERKVAQTFLSNLHFMPVLAQMEIDQKGVLA